MLFRVIAKKKKKIAFRIKCINIISSIANCLMKLQDMQVQMKRTRVKCKSSNPHLPPNISKTSIMSKRKKVKVSHWFWTLPSLQPAPYLGEGSSQQGVVLHDSGSERGRFVCDTCGSECRSAAGLKSHTTAMHQARSAVWFMFSLDIRVVQIHSIAVRYSRKFWSYE